MLNVDIRYIFDKNKIYISIQIENNNKLIVLTWRLHLGNGCQSFACTQIIQRHLLSWSAAVCFFQIYTKLLRLEHDTFVVLFLLCSRINNLIYTLLLLISKSGLHKFSLCFSCKKILVVVSCFLKGMWH